MPLDSVKRFMENNLKQLCVLCPVCNNFIPIVLPQVLFTESVACDTCASHFSPDQNSAEQLWKQVQQSNFSF